MAWRGRVKTTSGEKSSDLGRMCHYQPLLIVHYHRLTVIDHLAVGLIDAVTYGSKEPVAAARARTLVFLPPTRLFLINKATSKCAICANRFIDGRKTKRMRKACGLAHLSIIASLLRERTIERADVCIANNYHVKCRIEACTRIPREL